MPTSDGTAGLGASNIRREARIAAWETLTMNGCTRLQAEISALWLKYMPSERGFFRKLGLPGRQLALFHCLDDLYTRYQAAMHATRVMAYHLPHLDSIDLRMAKIRLLADDDMANDGDSHHRQLRRTWRFMLGRDPTMGEEDFGELEHLAPRLDHATARFVLDVQRLYPETLGPWLMIEGLAHDWIGALMTGLREHFPGVERTDYFLENFSSCVEVRHAEEALATVENVVSRRPELIDETVRGADHMGASLDVLWQGMEELIENAGR